MNVLNDIGSARVVSEFPFHSHREGADDLLGKPSFSFIAGKPTVLLILGTYCNICKGIARLLSGLHDGGAGDISCAGICVKPNCHLYLSQFMDSASCQIPLGYSPLRDLCVALNIPASTWLLYPTLVFIDQERRMRGYVSTPDSFFEDTEENLELTIDLLLNEAFSRRDAA